MITKRFTRYLIALLLTGSCTLSQLRAQDQTDSLMNSLDQSTKHDYTIAIFKDSRVVNFHTVETAGKRSLDVRISHRFAPISTGINNFYGVDGPASIRLALEYSYDGRLQFGLGRSNVEKLVDGYAKYKLLRQRNDNSMPVTVDLLAGMNITTQKAILPNQYDYFTSRLSYEYQVMVARKFSERLSLQLSPTLVHYNLVQNTTDKNDVFAVVALGRYKFTSRMAVTGEYAIRVSPYMTTTYTSADPYHNCASIGWEIETGGHVFSVHLSNAQGMVESQTIAHTPYAWGKREISIGFNISRVFFL